MQVNNEPSLRMLLAGTLLTEAEAKRWKTVFGGKRWFLPIVAFILSAFFTVGMIPSVLEQQPTWYERLGAGVLLLACCIAASVWFLKLLRYPEKLRDQQWKMYVADAKYRSPRRIEVYDDRVVEITARHRKAVWFSQVTLAVETADGFAISNGYACIILRAADMIDFDIAAFRLLLQQRVAEAYRCQKGVARPRLPIPLPIPKSEALVAAEGLCTISKSYCETALYRGVRKKRIGLMAGIGAPMMTVLAMISATLAKKALFSGFFVLQWGVSMLFFAAMIAFLLLFPENKYNEKINFVFTTDGIVTTFLGNTQFCPKESVTFEKVKAGVAINYDKQPLLVLSDNEWQTFMNLDKIEDSTNE